MEKIIPQTDYNPKSLFPRGANFNRLQVTREGISSITTHKIAREIAYSLRKYRPKLIIDATANVGGNSIAFGVAFKRVIACEIKRATYDVLCANLCEYGLMGVTPLLCDFNHMVRLLPVADIVFIDPPWLIDGGFNLSLSLTCAHSVWNLPIEETMLRVWYRMPKAVIAIKVPKRWRIRIIESYVISFKKMDILVFERCASNR